MPDCCVLIINPTSGQYSKSKVSKALAALQACGRDPLLLFTAGSGDATRFAGEICRKYENPLIIAGGGDGTVNEVLNGLVPGRGTLAVLPFGTANVLAKELGIRSVDDAVQRVVRGETRPLSVGLVSGEGISRYFLLMAGVGLDGEIVEKVRKKEKKVLKQGAYLLSALRCVMSWERERLEVEADGDRLSCHSLVICNAAGYGGSFRLAPGASLFTPDFRVVCVMSDARTAFLRLAVATVFGRNAECPQIRRLTAKKLTVSGRKAVQVDGDFCGYSPVQVEAVEGFARLVV